MADPLEHRREEERRRAGGQQPPVLQSTFPSKFGTTTRTSTGAKVEGEMGLSLSPSMLEGERRKEEHFRRAGATTLPPRDLSQPYTKQEEARTNYHMTNTGRTDGSLATRTPVVGGAASPAGASAAPSPSVKAFPSPFTAAAIAAANAVARPYAAPVTTFPSVFAGSMSAARPMPVAGGASLATSSPGVGQPGGNRAAFPNPFDLRRTGAGFTEMATMADGRQRQVAYTPTGQEALQNRFGASWMPRPGERFEQTAARRRAILQANPAQSPQGRVIAGGSTAPDHRGNFVNPFALQTNGGYGPVNTYDPTKDNTVARVGPGQIAVNPKYATPGSSGIASVRYPANPFTPPINSASSPAPKKPVTYRNLGDPKVRTATTKASGIPNFGGLAPKAQPTTRFAGVNLPVQNFFGAPLPKPDFQAVKDLSAAQPVRVQVGDTSTTLSRSDAHAIRNASASDLPRMERIAAFNNRHPGLWPKMAQYNRERRSFADIPSEERSAFRDYLSATAPANDLVGNTVRRVGEAVTRAGKGTAYEGSGVDRWVRNKLKASRAENRVAIHPVPSWDESVREYKERQKRVAGK